MLLAYKRWTGLEKSMRPPGPPRANSLYNIQAPTSETIVGNLAAKAAGHITVSEITTPAADASSMPTPELRVTPVLVRAPSEEEIPGPPLVEEVADQMLLVDDNHINLKILSAYMGKLGRPYQAVTNGKEAVDAYTEHPGRFAGILMDISMPVMDGLEATRRIRAHEHRVQLRTVPIVALTGLASDSTHQEAMESGVDVFLTKPVRLKTLSEVLESMDILPPVDARGV
jgi:CheY-like chemotaxis protein